MPDPVRYNRWEDIPSHLQTRTQLVVHLGAAANVSRYLITG
jgi:hypothetical protein